jgi:hypothetical protein
MSTPVVAIGFILLIPSALGMLFAILMLFLTGAASKATSASNERQIRAELVAHGIPDSIINKIASDTPLSHDDVVSLTYQQQTAVREAESSRLGQKVGDGVATVVAGGFSTFVFVAAFIGGLLGWLLVMRKRVLQCARCGAVVPAS